MATPNTIIANNGAGASYTFITLEGQHQPMQQSLVEITRPGVDGIALRREGKRSRPYQLLGTVDCNDQTAAESLYASLAGLTGTLVAVSDPFGVQTNDVACLLVERVAQHKLLAAVGGQSALKQVLLVVRFTLQDTAV